MGRCCFRFIGKAGDFSVGVNCVHVCLENLNSELRGRGIKVINNWEVAR